MWVQRQGGAISIPSPPQESLGNLLRPAFFASHINHPQPEQRPSSIPHTDDAAQTVNWRCRKQRRVIAHRVFSGQKLTTRAKDRETS